MQIGQVAPYGIHWRERRTNAAQRSLDHLLAMAHRHRKQGNQRQAMEMYWMLLKGHSGTTQSLEAQVSLPELAKSYERDDGRPTARAVYERIL